MFHEEGTGDQGDGGSSSRDLGKYFATVIGSVAAGYLVVVLVIVVVIALVWRRRRQSRSNTETIPLVNSL